MPFIPHTQKDVEQMLQTIGAGSIEELFDEIPESLKISTLKRVPEGRSEMATAKLMSELAAKDGRPACFVGAGAYEHHIPAAVWEITTRGEFYSAYTPYQAEASQGTLQVIYEYQSMMAKLTGMEVSNASLYDGASALAEAVLMAIRCNRKSKSNTVLVPKTVHPDYRRVMQALLAPLKVNLIWLNYDSETGQTNPDEIEAYQDQDITAVVIPQPNFFGVLEPVDELTNAAHALRAMVVAVVNPMSLALLEAPGNWGDQGADIVCGEGQPMGVPLSSGGPYYGILCCKQAYVRQMPGRLVGRTVDLDGKEGFALTLQAREQHIRRAKATSNICTNQGLLVTASTIYMALLGADGLEQVASHSHQNTNDLVQRLSAIDGVELIFNSPRFHECAIRLSKSANAVIEAMAEHKIVAGYDLQADYPEMGNAMLICATETKSIEDLRDYCEHLAQVLAA